MGACEPGQARDRAAISGNFHVPGFSLKAVFFYAPTACTAFFSLRFSIFAFSFPSSSSGFSTFFCRRRPFFPFPLLSLKPLFYRRVVFSFCVLKNFAEFAKKSDKIAPRRLFYRAFRLK